MTLTRRELLRLTTTPCPLSLAGITAESNETPFFEHFHSLYIPASVLINLPVEGIVIKTSPLDLDSYDVDGFRKFVQATGLNPEIVRKHDHLVKITRPQLQRIAAGEQNVEIRVISNNSNYVHNFLITASPAILAKVRKAKG